ncbi:hypothetical protein GCK72_021819 [Caenorhabditis remanei]|uniref:Uncharacterized protein n=1 Tax=Caenorhabditis remanei TaxID=31234 RepID=A0A6A5GJ45_CAERE|nr:hypothetical protein GCK72_021819 [Caenorhabditis remanei]KAF1755250.1 hypothetical protein GCK72_021819 [Caenorhabditis remanei]
MIHEIPSSQLDPSESSTIDVMVGSHEGGYGADGEGVHHLVATAVDELEETYPWTMLQYPFQLTPSSDTLSVDELSYNANPGPSEDWEEPSEEPEDVDAFLRFTGATVRASTGFLVST